MTTEELYEAVVAQGIEHTNHHSDLYIPVNAVTQELVNRLAPEEHGLVSTFKNNKDNKPWYDISFAYKPHWEKLEKERLQFWNIKTKQEKDKDRIKRFERTILGKHQRSYMLRGLDKDGDIIIDHVYSSMKNSKDVADILSNFKKMGCVSAEVLEEAYILKQVINEL